MSPFCQLLETSLDQENPFFIEGSFQDQNDENIDISNTENIAKNLGILQMLRIRAICEGNPEARLIRDVSILRKPPKNMHLGSILSPFSVEFIYFISSPFRFILGLS